MRWGVDTNVLIYAHVPAFPEHLQVRNLLRRQLDEKDHTLVVTPHILHELVHVLSDPRRFDPPIEMAEALALAALYLNRPNVWCLPVDGEVLGEAFELLARHRLGRKRIADTLFAAALLHHGVDRLITLNPGDFRVFEGLEVIDPREEIDEIDRSSPAGG